MHQKPTLSAMEKAYAFWAPFYDMLYHHALHAPRQAAVKASLGRGRRILEVGVGTGLSLADYPPGFEVTGVDLSKPMLDQARKRIAQQGLTTVTGLAVMDACRLGFRDGSFDTVMAQYVIALVPDADAAMDEFARAVRAGGDIVIVNHMGRQTGVIALWEKAIAPIAGKIGLSSAFPAQRLLDWAARSGFEIVSVETMGPLGFYTVMRLRKPGGAEEKASAA
jgi:phosphatidylethanolamine/phosphatidyl-N-methylethanolamine N-methyltransferase